jgi:hypothetical protein
MIYNGQDVQPTQKTFYLRARKEIKMRNTVVPAGRQFSLNDHAFAQFIVEKGHAYFIRKGAI